MNPSKSTATTKPKGKIGMAQVKKLGRTKKTGGFNKIEEKAEGEGKSAASAKKIAGAVFQKQVRARQAKLIHR